MKKKSMREKGFERFMETLLACFAEIEYDIMRAVSNGRIKTGE